MTSPNTESDKSIDDAINNLAFNLDMAIDDKLAKHTAVLQFKSTIDSLLMDVIGEDEQLGEHGYRAQPIKPKTVGEERMIVRNVFRTELRQEFAKLFNKEEIN